MIVENPAHRDAGFSDFQKNILYKLCPERSFLMEHYTLPYRHNQSMSQLMSHLPNIGRVSDDRRYI